MRGRSTTRRPACGRPTHGVGPARVLCDQAPACSANGSRMHRDRSAKPETACLNHTARHAPDCREPAAGLPLASLPGVPMRRHILSVAVSALFPLATAHAAGEFIAIETPSVQLTGVSPSGEYAVGSIAYTAAFRWTASTGEEALLAGLNS